MKKDTLPLTPKDGVFAYLLALAVSLVLSVLLPLFEGNAYVVLSYLFTQIPFLLVPFVFLKLRRVDYLNAIQVKTKIKPLPLLFIIPISIGAFLQNTLLSVAFNWLLEALGTTPSVTLPSLDTPLNVVLAVITICILPALSEEFLFRGVMLSAYRERGIMGSCILVSVIFALSHFNTAQLVHQVILGFILAYLVSASGSIWYSVGVHLLNNLFALFIGKLIPSYAQLAVLSMKNVAILSIMCVIGAVILISSLYAFSKFAVKEELKTQGNFFNIFSKNKSPLWYRDTKKPLDYITVGLIVFMVVLLVLTTAISNVTV